MSACAWRGELVEWFLREAFGARVLPAEAFTAGLVQRGILSLGMG